MRQRKKEEEERKAAQSSGAGFFSFSSNSPSAPAPFPSLPEHDSDTQSPPSSSSSSSFLPFSSLHAGLASTFGRGGEDHEGFHQHDGDGDDAPFDPEAADYSDVFLGSNPTRPHDGHEEYGWWQRAQNRYRVFGGTRRMCGCSGRTCIIVTVVVIVVILVILLIIAWSNKGALMFI